ncbi:MAG TPA: sensor domain-containing protein [Solirubrobacteraceae bacterium]|nr:sensor domain-containing protein [Solirubrobacteraceae bacterium]
MASLRPRSLLRQAPRDLLYVGLSGPIGLAWLIVIVSMLAVGFGLSVVIIGIPLLVLIFELIRLGARAERARAGLVLGTPIAQPVRPRAPGGFLRRVWGRITDRAGWKEIGFMLLLATVGTALGVIVLALWSGAVAAIVAPAVHAAAPSRSLLGRQTAWALIGIVIGGFVLAALTLLVTRGFAAGLAAIAKWLLAVDDRAVLAARVDTLEATRAAAVESADARLRRLERDLHDGAQHRLSYIAMELDRARAKLADDPEAASELLGRAHEESKRAMGELRDLVRGIHPSVLTDRGLDAAVSGLAERCPVPVDVDIHVDPRPSTAIETAAYYVVAEALTNVGKHAGARSASVDIHRDGSALSIWVWDDGQGGASRRPGSGLEGLAQRVEALDGSLTVTSPSGGPTVIRAEIPCGS